jgi:hypothetical protein
MLRRVVIGAAMACLMGGSAYAVDEPAAEDSECAQQLVAAQEVVQDKVDANALSEADSEKVYALLDQAGEFCTNGNAQEASAALATVNSMVSKAK